MVGGALSQAFADSIGADGYAPDAVRRRACEKARFLTKGTVLLAGFRPKVGQGDGSSGRVSAKGTVLLAGFRPKRRLSRLIYTDQIYIGT